MAAASLAPLLIDTDVLIDFLRRRVDAKEFITEALASRSSVYYASVTITELFAGIRFGEETATESLLSAMVSIPLTNSIPKDAGDYLRQFRSQGITLSVPDTIIAAWQSRLAPTWQPSTLNISNERYRCTQALF